jgi:uncharacterized protein
MLSKEIIGNVVKDQLNEFELLRDTVPRTRYPEMASYKGTSVFVVKGLRRCGKSTLLKQIITREYNNDFCYFNFDDDRIMDFKVEDFQTLMEVFVELFGNSKNLFFDEIQNIAGWELFINRILRQGYRVFITGSNANLLSKELGTHLTGRHIDIELYPFSFQEFLKFKNKLPSKRFYTTKESADIFKEFKQYFLTGGLPESVVFSNN